MTHKLKTCEILLPSLRQYQHNDCSGLLAGFEYDETVRIVSLLQKKIKEQESEIKSLSVKLIEIAITKSPC